MAGKQQSGVVINEQQQNNSQSLLKSKKMQSSELVRIHSNMMEHKRDTSAWSKFKLLMWKNWLLQWRHKWRTFFAILLPMVVVCLVLLIRSVLDVTTQPSSKYPSYRPDYALFAVKVIKTMNESELSIAYSPTSEILEDVVRSAMTAFFFNNAELFPKIVIPSNKIAFELAKKRIRVDTYDNSRQLENIFLNKSKIRTVLAGIEFDNGLKGAKELPNDVSFSLRFPNKLRLFSFYGEGGLNWKTNSLYPTFELPGPRFPFSWTSGNDPGYVDELFIALQHVISNEIVSRKNKRDRNSYYVTLNRFPHPEYLQDYTISVLQHLVPMFIVFGYSYSIINLVRAIVTEKETQLKDTMKIMGLPTWLHWTAWFTKQFIFLLISCILIVIMLKVPWFSNKSDSETYGVLNYTPWHVLFFFLLLYLTCSIFFCFMISGFLARANNASLIASIIWVLFYTPSFLTKSDTSSSYMTYVFTSLFLNAAMVHGFTIMMSRESTGGLQWSEFWKEPVKTSRQFSFGNVIVMLFIDCILYMLIGVYLEQVFPGQYGSPEPWNFFIRKDYWIREKIPKQEETTKDGILTRPEEGTTSDKSVRWSIENDSKTPPQLSKGEDSKPLAENAPTEQYNIVKEDDPTGHKIGVRIKNLTKVFPKLVAVDNLSLKIYDNQITVLLGHNGAGKSTTISMLTGSIVATKGSMIVAGYDMVHNPRNARLHIGVCPQNNVFFSDLTIGEHLEFFARLKGFEGQTLKDDVNILIEKLDLEPKRNNRAKDLSGGQKRRLQVGIALCGGAKVIFLDEPTSGVDPATRRSIWELLQKEKDGRSMILTTHFMDEADILGDRIAIMANGKLQCVGSPYFLKRMYSVGYRLVVVKEEGFDSNVFQAKLSEHIPDVTIHEDRGSEISYYLPNEQSNKFSVMLIDIEKDIGRLKFKSYGLLSTSLEDVFLSVGSDAQHVGTADATNQKVYADYLLVLDEPNQKEKGKLYQRLWLHCKATWYKLWHTWRRARMILLLQVLLPILIMNGCLIMFKTDLSEEDDTQPRKLSLYAGYQSTETLVSYTGTSSDSIAAKASMAYEKMLRSGNRRVTRITEGMDEYYMKRGADRHDMAVIRRTIVIGATFTEKVATAWYSNFGYHDIAVALAAAYEALLKANNPTATFAVYNHPLKTLDDDEEGKQLILAFLGSQLSFGIGMSMAIVSSVFVIFYVKERVSRAKLLQITSGIEPYTMWLSAAFFDWCWFVLISLVVIIAIICYNLPGLNEAGELGTVLLFLMIYGFSMLPFIYVCSLIYNKPAAGFSHLCALNVILGVICSDVVTYIYEFASDGTIADIIDYTLQFFPLYALVAILKRFIATELLKWSCLSSCPHIRNLYPNLNECNLQVLCLIHKACCFKDKPMLHWKSPGVLRYTFTLIFSGLVAWLILMLYEYGIFNKFSRRSSQPPPKPLEEDKLDEDVRNEMHLVEGYLKTKNVPESCSLIAHGLTKYYGKNLAVNQISFTVSDNDCFGLLGVNGAGKTSTFKMLIGDYQVSYGDAFINGASVRTDITKVHKNIGYCPQFDAILEEMTGRETLTLFCMLHGFSEINAISETLSDVLGFHRHLDKKVENYSGGNKRKLSTAIALLGHARLLFVDEPTTGVDPAAKRQVWRGIQGAQNAGRGVVLTSHSMEECEALCTRLTVMVNGQFQCLGTPQHLKNKFSEGFTLIAKIMMVEDLNVLDERTINLKKYIDANFSSPKLMEEYDGLLTYYVSDTQLRWSAMFEMMEGAKKDLYVEDYTITQTTLEQIFLHFTKYQVEASAATQ